MGSSGDRVAGVGVGVGVSVVLVLTPDALGPKDAAGAEPAHPESAPRTARTTADAATAGLAVDVCVFTMNPR